MYKTILSLEDSSDSAGEDRKLWLIYWVVFGFMGSIEAFTAYLLYFIPFYYPLKLTLLLWCMSPTLKGSKQIYYNVILPLSGNDVSTSDVDAALSKKN